MAELSAPVRDWLKTWVYFEKLDEHFVHGMDQFSATAILSQFDWNMLLTDQIKEGKKAAASLLQWSREYRIAESDTWIFDVALHSIAYAMIRKSENIQWGYRPPDDLRQPFRPPALHWEYSESEQDFKTRCWRSYDQALKTYFGRARTIENRPKTSNEQCAQWAAEIFTGRTRAELAAREPRGKSLESAEYRVYQDVWRYVRSIGLTLPTVNCSGNCRDTGEKGSVFQRILE
ncbi:MAG: hypothetical protein ACR2NN_26655 [Bryobacteraceae bacterium]